MNNTLSLRLEADYKGQVAGILLPLQGCFSLRYWLPISSEDEVSFDVIVREVVSRDILYERTFDVEEGETIIEGEVCIGQGCHELEFIVIAADPLAPPVFIEGPNNNLTIIPIF